MQYEFFNAEGKPLNFEQCCIEDVAVVRDAKTGLDWEAKSFESDSFNYFKKKMSWDEFNTSYISWLNEKNYGGFSDWRVPSKDELRSLIDYRKIAPAFPQEIFSTLVNDDYWCGLPYGLRTDCGWVMNLNVGSATAKNKSL